MVDQGIYKDKVHFYLRHNFSAEKYYPWKFEFSGKGDGRKG